MQTNEVGYNQPNVQRQIEHMQNSEVGYNQPTVQRQIEQTINKPIEFNQAASLEYKHPNNQQQTIQNIPNTNQIVPVVNQPRSYNRPIGYEEKSYLCIWCETPTKFNDHKKLGKHIERFHAAFNQKNKGVKRGNDEDNKILPKRLRWNVTGIPDDDDDLNGENNYNEEGSDNNTDEGSEYDTDVGSEDDSLDEISPKRIRGKGIQILDKDGYDADDEDEDNKILPKRLRWNVTGIPGDDKYIDDTETDTETDTDEDEETDEETDVDEDDADKDEETDEETDVEDEDEYEENNGNVEDIIQVLKYIKSIKGDYQGFAEHANSKDIHNISNCCFNLIYDNIPLHLSKKKKIRRFLKPIRKEINTLSEKNESVKKKRKILSDPQIGHGIFTMLVSMILPAIISAITK